MVETQVSLFYRVMKGVDFEDNMSRESKWEDGYVVGNFYCTPSIRSLSTDNSFSLQR